MEREKNAYDYPVPIAFVVEWTKTFFACHPAKKIGRFQNHALQSRYEQHPVQFHLKQAFER
jgi:hypothetical protein